MTLAIDTTSGHSDPAGAFFRVGGSPLRTINLPSNDIIAPASSLLVVMSTTNCSTATQQTMTIADTAGLTWTQIGQQDDGINGSTFGVCASAWWAYTTAGVTTAVTVTATVPSSGLDEGNVSVLVFTGADPVTPIGAVANNHSNVSPLVASLTPTRIGSIPIVAVADWAGAAAPTGGTGCTAMASYLGPTGSSDGGTARLTTPNTTSLSPVTLSMVQATSPSFNWLAFEVLPELAFDSSSDLQGLTTTKSGNHPQTFSSNSFSPPANSLLVVTAQVNCASAVAQTHTLTDSLATHLTWTQLDQMDAGVSGSTYGMAVSVWSAPVGPTAPGSMFLALTSAASNNMGQASITVQVVTGADPVTPLVAQGKGHSATSPLSVSVTPTRVGSIPVLAVPDWSGAGTPTAGTGCQALSAWLVSPDCDGGVIALSGLNTTSLTPVTLSAVQATTPEFNWLAYEILPASAATSVTVTSVVATESLAAGVPAIIVPSSATVRPPAATQAYAGQAPTEIVTEFTSGGGPAAFSLAAPAPSLFVGANRVTLSTTAGTMALAAGIPVLSTALILSPTAGTLLLVAPSPTLDVLQTLYLFTPDMRQERHRLAGSLFYRFDVSSTVWLKDGVWQEKFFPLDSEVFGGVLLTNTGPVVVDAATAANLTAAGIGTVELIPAIPS